MHTDTKPLQTHVKAAQESRDFQNAQKPPHATPGLIYPFQTPAFGKPYDFGDGRIWLRVPLPYDLDHVNLWLDRLPNGKWRLIDTGSNTPENIDILNAVLSDFPVDHVLVTHFHPDHIGLAAHVQKRFDAPVYMTPRERAVAISLFDPETIHALSHLYRTFYTAHGCPDDLVNGMVKRAGGFRHTVQHLPAEIRDISSASAITDDYEILIGGGHSPQHACLIDKKRNQFIAGDIILPRISPNISIWPEMDAPAENGLTHRASSDNPLADYYDSLDRIESRIDPDWLVLPSHNDPFYGLKARIDALRQHHDYRLHATYTLMRDSHSLTAFDAAEKLFKRTISLADAFFMIGETLAHLEYLVFSGHAQKTIRDDGKTIYSALTP